MSEWDEYNIGDLLKLEYGKSLSDYRNGDGLYDVFGTNGKIGTTNSYLYDQMSLVIGRKGAYREVHLANSPFYVIDTAFYTKPLNDLTYTLFMYYWFKNVDINSMDSGSAIPSTSRDEVYELDIRLPSIPEQYAIASVLSSLDDKIDLLHRQNQTLEQMAETLFRQWFVEEADDDWKIGTLNDVLTVKGGTTPSTKNPDYWDGDIHWTSPRDITTLKSIYLFDTERKITEAGLKKISSGLLPKGTLLMSSRAPVGVLAFAEVPIAINQGYIAILDDKGFSKEFLFLWLKTNMDYVQSYANGSTFLEISKSAFKSLEIQIPPKKLRNEFQEWVTSHFKKIKSNQTQIRTLTALRDTLLPKLMSGEVEVNTKELSNVS